MLSQFAYNEDICGGILQEYETIARVDEEISHSLIGLG